MAPRAGRDALRDRRLAAARRACAGAGRGPARRAAAKRGPARAKPHAVARVCAEEEPPASACRCPRRDVPDGQFFAWLGQAQWARRPGFDDWQLSLRGDVRLTGPAAADRADRDWRALHGARLPQEPARGRQRPGRLGGAADSARPARDPPPVPRSRRRPAPAAAAVRRCRRRLERGRRRSPSRTSSTGIGAGPQWQLNPRLRARIHYSLPLRKVHTPDNNDLQDLALDLELAAALY